MVKKIIIITGLCFISLGFFNCNKEVKVKTESNFDLLEENQNDIQNPKKVELVKTIHADSLIQFLPEAIPGTSVSPLKSGSIDETDVIITTISREYIYKNNGFLKFSISDYGAIDKIPDFEKRLLNNPPEESGKITQIISVPYGKGYSLWDEIRRTGSFYGMVGNRFLLRIDGYNLPKDFINFQEFVRYFKIERLLEYARNN